MVINVGYSYDCVKASSAFLDVQIGNLEPTTEVIIDYSP
jgi:hypothetical protein